MMSSPMVIWQDFGVVLFLRIFMFAPYDVSPLSGQPLKVATL